MSEATPARAWRFYAEDLAVFFQKVLDYTAGLNKDAFASNPMCVDATVRNLELIGEAATHIPWDARLLAPEVPWRQVVATRNLLIHGYLGIDMDTLWSIIETDIPHLLAALQPLRSVSP